MRQVAFNLATLFSSSVAALEKFTEDFNADKIKPYIKSEPVPENNDGPVKVGI